VKKIGVLMDPIERINIIKDSTFSMMLAAQQQNWQIYYMEIGDLFVDNGIAKANSAPITVFENSEQWFSKGNSEDINLGDLDAILMRKDPPFDMEFIAATYVLEMAEKQGCLVVNKPQSLRDCNEKMFINWFPQCTAPCICSSNKQKIEQFWLKHEDIILKPLNGMGGESIFRVRKGDPNFSVIWETLTNNGQEMIMVQKFIPEISSGDKRVLLINGEPVPYALARIPAEGETRGNLAAGGSGVAQPINDRDRWICQQIAPTLREKGLIFVGIDIIGDYLTEINVTSPTCIQEINRAYKLDIAGDLINAIKEKIN
jgi:glutathione synthase